MSAPDRDAVEREALIDVLVMSAMSDHVGTSMKPIEQTAAAILAAGWSRSPRPAAVSERRLAAALYRLEWDADLYATPRGRETERYERRAQRLAAALPHLAPGQIEEAIRDDERAKVAERIESDGREFLAWLKETATDGLDHARCMGVQEQIERAAHIARTAPAEDGAE